jgi:hypothetical protein
VISASQSDGPPRPPVTVEEEQPTEPEPCRQSFMICLHRNHRVIYWVAMFGGSALLVGGILALSNNVQSLGPQHTGTANGGTSNGP